MPAILGSKPVTVAVMTTLIAGDFLRHALTVPVWATLGILCALWGFATLFVHRSALRTIPLPLIALYGWWAITAFWSSYPSTTWLMVFVAALFIVTGVALAVTLTGHEFVRRLALSLRWVLGGSLAFELVVGFIGAPVYPVGFVPTANTPIEMAWSRAQLFALDGRIQGLVGNANILGMLALIALIVAGYTVYQAGSWRNVGAVDALVAVIVLARTLSATVTLALLAVSVVAGLLWLSRRLSIRPVVSVMIASGLALVAAAIAAANWGTVTSLLGKSSDLTHRVDIWSAVIDRVRDKPLVGHGFVGWWPDWEPWFGIVSVDGLRMSQAHNVWLDLAMQTGIIGVVLFAVVLTVALWTLWRRACEAPTGVATLALLTLVALTVQSLAESRFLHEWGLAAFALCSLVAFRVKRSVSERR